MQLGDTKILKRERFKFGFGNILYQSEEIGLGAIPAVVIRALGGDARHLGIASASGGITSICQFVGTLLIKKFQSNRKAMVWVTLVGFVLMSLNVPVLIGSRYHVSQHYALYAFICLGFGVAVVNAAQWNIESSWIGDLVPGNRLGWFTSAKWIFAGAGVFVFTLLFGQICDISPNVAGYSIVYGILAVSLLIAAWIMSTITDRVPSNASFFSNKAHERINYRSRALLCYIIFYLLWAGGRGGLNTFTGIYLVDHFHFSMIKIAGILSIAPLLNCLVIYVLGKFTDRSGHRWPLIAVSAFCGLSMGLWVVSAWAGVTVIIIFQVINGFALNSHSMLATNYGLEIFPDKGRSAYLAIARFAIGAFSVAVPIAFGGLVYHLESFKLILWGAAVDKYHVAFALATMITLCCTIPLFIAGNRKVELPPQPVSLPSD